MLVIKKWKNNLNQQRYYCSRTSVLDLRSQPGEPRALFFLVLFSAHSLPACLAACVPDCMPALLTDCMPALLTD